MVIGIIVFKRYPSTYCLMQGSCFLCSDFQNFNILPHLKLESQPLREPVSSFKKFME